MDEFWGKALIFAFVVVLVLLCIVEGCFSSDRRCRRPRKSLQYWQENSYSKHFGFLFSSSQYQMMTQYWRKERKEVCQNQILINGYAMATTGLTTRQTPHILGSGSNQSRQLDGNFEEQSRRLKEADPNSLFSHGSEEAGTTVRQNYPGNHSESSTQLDRWGEPVRHLANNPKPVKHAFDNAFQVHDNYTVERSHRGCAFGDKTLSEKCAYYPVYSIYDKCPGSKMVRYCSSQCREMHWKSGHKKLCDRLICRSTIVPSRSSKSSEEPHTKPQKLRKINDKVVEENQVLQCRQHDIEKELECLRRQREFGMEIYPLELQEATCNFDERLKIGKGGYGSVYKGILCCTRVAIKVLHNESNQGEREFFQEVEILRKVRHPNIVTLIGVCSQIQALIYEFIPNGSLDKYLGDAPDRQSLSWEVRVQIASDICSALIFLHSTKPHGIAHGDLKPANILLDSNYQGKLSDFGISRQLKKTDDTTTAHHLTDQPKGTHAYMDPEYLQTGEINPHCDVYAFGVILLQLVTGKIATGIYKSVLEALKSKKLNKEIDASANWPSDKASKMAKLGVRCCNPAGKKRPDLATEVWREIESLKPSPVF